MSDETIKQTGTASSSCDDNNKPCSAVRAQFVAHSTTKTPISVLSPHVAEFVPKSLKKEKPSLPKSTLSEEEDFIDVPGVEKLSKKPGDDGDDGDCSRGWWDEAPLKIKMEKTSARNVPTPHYGMRQVPERTHRQPKNETTGNSWRREQNNKDLDFNWRLGPSHNDQDKPKNNELGLVRRDITETRKKDFGGFSKSQERCSSSSSFEGKKFQNESGRSKDKVEGASRVMDGEQQRQQGSARIGASRGRGRGRMAWMNDSQNQNNRNDVHRDPKISDQHNKRKVGHGRGLRSNTLNQIGNTVAKQKEKETDKSSTVEDDGWIVVRSKKKMDEQKESGNKTKEKMRIETPFSSKSKEMNERDDKMTGINSQQKMEKWKRKQDEKKERKADFSDQERKTVQNQETTSKIIATNDLERREKLHKGNSKAVFESEKDGEGSMKSGRKINKHKQDKQPKKLEIVKVIKTEQNSTQKEVKILLKRDNESNQFLKAEQTALPDPGFNRGEGEDEFPDLATSSKAGSSSLASDWLSGGSRMPIISYSAILKAMPKPKTQPSRNLPNEKVSSATQHHDENEGQSKKKKKKKKKKANDNDGTAKQAPQEPKKTKQPMQFDLGDWLSTIEKCPPKISKDKQTNPKKAVTIATGVLQIQVKDQPSATSRVPSVKATHGLSTKTDKPKFHNILDSTAPVVKRGKEREIPKKKKPSQMKRIILKEREEKRKALEGDENQEEKREPQSLGEDNQLPEEAIEEHESEDQLSNEDNDATVNHSKDDVIAHHHGNPNATSADVSIEGDQNAAPSEDDVKAQIHSRRFREYCDNVMDKELNNTTLQLIQKLVMFQDRQYHKDPVKSKAKRRFVVGLREVTKHLKLKKIKLVIISPNVERIKSAGGLDDTLHNIISVAHQNGVPVVFALRRQVLGRVLHKKVPVSALGVFYYDGAEDEYKKLMDLTEKARDIYAQRWKAAYDELVERIQKERAEEMSRDIQEQDSSSRDQCDKESEIPSESKTDVSENALNESNIKEMRKMQEDNESECKRNQENEWEREEKMKDELLDQKENSTKESEDDSELETEENESEEVEKNETNKINEWDNIVQSTEGDLTVEEL